MWQLALKPRDCQRTIIQPRSEKEAKGTVPTCKVRKNVPYVLENCNEHSIPSPSIQLCLGTH